MALLLKSWMNPAAVSHLTDASQPLKSMAIRPLLRLTGLDLARNQDDPDNTRLETPASPFPLFDFIF
jgi:hypothetical protein